MATQDAHTFQEAIQTNVTVSYIHKSSLNHNSWEALHNCKGINRKWNAKLKLSGQLQLTQNDAVCNATVTWNYDQIQFEKLEQGLATADRWGHEAKIAQRDGWDAETEDIEKGPISAHLFLRILGAPTHKIDPFPGKRPHHISAGNDFSIVVNAPVMARLRIDFYDVKCIKDWDKRRVIALLSGERTWNPNRIMQDFLQSERAAVEAEKLIAIESLKGIDGKYCTVWTEKYRDERSVLVCIEPPGSNGQTCDWETILNSGQLLELENNGDFSFNESTKFRSTSGDQTEGWIARVVHGLDRVASITAVLEHWFMGKDFDHYSQLSPCEAVIRVKQNDITLLRANEVLDDVEDLFEEEEFLQLSDALQSVPDRIPAAIPVHSICLSGEPVITEKTSLHVKGHYVAVDFSGSLGITNVSQREAIQNVFDHQVSLIRGPPGCAKTQTICFARLAMAKHFPDKTQLFCAPTNAACDEIGRKLEGLHIPFIRMMSWKMMETYIAQGKKATYWHLHEVMLREGKLPEYSHLVGAFFHGVQQLKEYGRITDRKVRKRYVSDRNGFMGILFAKYKFIVSTCTTSALKILIDHCPVEVLYIDEAAASKHYEVLLPVVNFQPRLKRLVLAGDHLQFAPFAASPAGKTWWSVTIFEKLMGEGWPTVLLNVCYRQHALLNGPLSELFYGGKLIAFHKNPSALAQRLLADMNDDTGVGFLNGEGTEVKLSGVCHFFDVANSHCEHSTTFSSRNSPENECAEAIMKSIISTGVDAENILHITGYHYNLSAMRKMGAAGEWYHEDLQNGSDIRTVYTSQGSERPIVILTLTRTMTEDELLLKSMLVRRRFLNVAISRPSQMLFIVGHWPSVKKLPKDNLIRTTMEFMDSHYSRRHQFLLRAGSSPFRQNIEEIVGPIPKVANTQTHIGREQQALLRIEEDEAEINRIRERVLEAYKAGDGFSEYMRWRTRLIYRENFLDRLRENRNWEVPVDASDADIRRSVLWPLTLTGMGILQVLEAYGHQTKTQYEATWFNVRAGMGRVRVLKERIQKNEAEVDRAQAGLDM